MAVGMIQTLAFANIKGVLQLHVGKVTRFLLVAALKLALRLIGRLA
jgi:hypothetical protein